MSRGWLVRLKALLRREAIEAEFDEELRYHLDREVERNVARGMTPEEARRAARRAVGDPTRLKEEARATWRWRWLDEVLQDLRYAGRSLRRSPGFTAVAVLSLGFGIGATTTVFSVIDALDFRPLPFQDASRLVWVTETPSKKVQGCVVCDYAGMSPATAAEVFGRTRSYAGFAVEGRSTRIFQLRTGNTVESPSVSFASPGFFRFLGVRPLLGRAFVPEDTLSGAPPVALLGYAFWQSRFGGDPGVIGRRLDYFDDFGDSKMATVTIVGVLPEGFRFNDVGGRPALWVPYSRQEAGRHARSWLFTDVARLRPGVTRAAADAELTALGAHLATSNPDEYDGWSFAVRPLRERFGVDAGRGRSTLFWISALVLLVAILNVAGLFLARTDARAGELAARSALGASRVRLVRLLLVEGIALGLLGGACGALLTVAGVHAANPWFRMAEFGLPIRLDGRILAFVGGVSVLVGVLTVVLPAIRTLRSDLAARLGGLAARTTSRGGARAGRGARLLSSVQIAGALVLVTGAGLLGSDFLSVRYVDLGFDPSGVQEALLIAGTEERSSPQEWQGLVERVRDGAARVAGVSGAALEDWAIEDVRTDRGYAIAASNRSPSVTSVDPSYFATLRIPIVAGRGFTSADRAGTTLVAIVNEAAAARFWPGRSALGRRVFVGDSASGAWLTVVGVTAGDAESLRRPGHLPVVYRPLAQVSAVGSLVTLYVRPAKGHAGALPAVQAVVRRVLGRPAFWQSLDGFFSSILARERDNALALNLFAAFALLLAAMGVYGNVAYGVSRRRREIGIRMALGARREGVLALMVRGGMRMLAGGVLLGFGGALMFRRVLRAFMSSTSFRATDLANPWLFAGSVVVLVLVVLVATWLPARRATRVDPVIALRSE